MWETPFDESMLDGQDLIIHCPDESLADELMEILERHGVRWYGDSGLPTDDSKWDEFFGETCYWVEDGRMTYGTVKDATSRTYSRHTKSTFFGVETPDFDTATEDEIFFFLTH